MVEEDEVTYIARAEVSRIMSIALRVGSRLPLYCTSMSRVLLASQPTFDQESNLARIKLEAMTERTETSPTGLLAILARTTENGYALVDQELELELERELGLRSVSVPFLSARGVLAAINVGTQAALVSVAELRSRHLPALLRIARELGQS